MVSDPLPLLLMAAPKLPLLPEKVEPYMAAVPVLEQAVETLPTMLSLRMIRFPALTTALLPRAHVRFAITALTFAFTFRICEVVFPSIVTWPPLGIVPSIVIVAAALTPD